MKHPDYQGYIDQLKEKKEQHRQMLEKKRQRGIALARKAAVSLKEIFGIDEVYLFGSLLDSNLFEEQSDIDLAINGVPPETYFAICHMLQDLLEDFTFDLVELDQSEERFRQEIHVRGEKL